MTCSPDWPCLCHETQTSLRFLTLLDSSQGLGFIGCATVLSNMKSILIATRVMPGKLEHYIYDMLYNIYYILCYILYIFSHSIILYVVSPINFLLLSHSCCLSV